MTNKNFVVQDSYVDDINATNQYIKYTSNMFIQKAAKYQKKYNLEMTPGTLGYNDETDAFRHAFMNAYFTLKDGVGTANLIGWEHELWYHKSPNMPTKDWKKETNMDKWNNAVGRKIGQEVAKEIKGKNYTDEQIEDIIAEKNI